MKLFMRESLDLLNLPMTKRYYIIFNLFILTAIIYAAVNMFYKITRSRVVPVQNSASVKQQIPEIEQRKKLPLSHFRVITNRNLFGSIDQTSEGKSADHYKDVEITALNLALLGTIASDDQQSSRAIIQDTAKRKQDLYKVGDSIQNAVVDKILRRQVILNVGGKEEKLIMEAFESSKRPSYGRREKYKSLRSSRGDTTRATTITVSKKDIEESLSDVNQILSQVRIRPHSKDGRSDGLAINRIKRGSIFSKLGLRNGDIIQEINGRGLNNPDDVFQLYESLKSGSGTSLQISRRGRPRTLNYKFR